MSPGAPRSVRTLPEVLRARLRDPAGYGLRDPDAARREDAGDRFHRVEQMVVLMEGLDDGDAEAVYQWLINEPVPEGQRPEITSGRRKLATAFCDHIRAARAQTGRKPS